MRNFRHLLHYNSNNFSNLKLISVNVYLESVSVDGKPIDFNASRISVTVTTPVVRIKRLSEEDIAKILRISCNDVTSKNRSKTNDLLNHIENEKMNSQLISNTVRCETEKPAKRLKVNFSNTCSEIQSDSQLPSSVICLQTEQPAKRLKLSSTPNSSVVQNTDSQSAINTVAVVEFTPDEVVWAKLKGHPHWPAKIVRHENKKYEIFWFNDYRKSKVFRSQIFKFNQFNFEKFSKTKKLGFEAALKEAILYGKAISH